MNALTFLGTGPGTPVADRSHSSALLETGGKRILIDAGEPCSRRLKELGVPLATIDSILLSHGHSDHTAGLMMLIQGAWLEARTRPLPIYLPGELIAPLHAWLEAAYLPEKLIGFPIEWRPWERATVPVDLGGIAVTISPTTHLHGLRALLDPDNRERFLAYSFALEAEGRRLVCSADLGAPEDLEAHLSAPCDVLVCELAHFEPEELFGYLQSKSIGRLYLTHLTARFQAEIPRIAALAAEMLPAPAHFLSDGDRFEW